MEAQLQHLADHDALTGLFNRRRFTEELERALARSRRRDDTGAVLFLDLDGFKFVNDTLGHAAGDALIARVGGLLRRTGARDGHPCPHGRRRVRGAARGAATERPR